MQTNDLSHEKQKLQDLFNSVAPVYDRIGPRFFSYFGQQLVKFTQIYTGSNVLDVAMGRGAVLFQALDVIGPQGYITGIDLSHGMVQEVNEEIRRIGVQNVELYQMDAESLQFIDDSFDVVFCAFAIYFFPEPNTAMEEMMRVLKAGGQIIIATWAGIKPDERLSWLNNLIDSYIPQGTRNKFELLNINCIFNQPEGLHKIMIEAGFSDIHIVPQEFEFVYSDEEEFWSMICSFPMKEKMDQINQLYKGDKLNQLKREFSKNFQLHKESDGLHVKLSALFAKGVKS